jgi:hypothetical protein
VRYGQSITAIWDELTTARPGISRCQSTNAPALTTISRDATS